MVQCYIYSLSTTQTLSLLKTTLQHEVLGKKFNINLGKVFISLIVYQVVFSVLAVSVQSAPQLLYGGYAGYPYAGHAVHAVPTVAKQTVNYKTAAFEPVDAATPADAQLIELKETDHSYDVLVPGPTKYVSTPVAYPHHYGKSVLTLSEPESF